MKSSIDLQNLLHQIDHKGYPAYKETKGIYDFKQYPIECGDYIIVKNII